MSKFKRRSRKIAAEQFWEKHDRESYQCPDCGRTELAAKDTGHPMKSAGGLEVHHKNGEPVDNRPENLVALCRLCHNIREGKKPSLNDIRSLRYSLFLKNHALKMEKTDFEGKSGDSR